MASLPNSSPFPDAIPPTRLDSLIIWDSTIDYTFLIATLLSISKWVALFDSQVGYCWGLVAKLFWFRELGDFLSSYILLGLVSGLLRYSLFPSVKLYSLGECLSCGRSCRDGLALWWFVSERSVYGFAPRSYSRWSNEPLVSRLKSLGPEVDSVYKI